MSSRLPQQSNTRLPSSHVLPPHLQRLEDEAIHVLREVVAEFGKPVLLYSVGKDSSVLLHLARKAFFPQRHPFHFFISRLVGIFMRCSNTATVWPPNISSSFWFTETLRQRKSESIPLKLIPVNTPD